MRALLDARVGRRPTGIGRYALQLAEQLAGLAPREVVPVTTRRHRRRLAAEGARPLVRSLGAELAASCPPADVVHGLNYHAPAVPGARRVATIHDLGFLALPDCHPPGMPERLDAIIRSTLADTALFLCDSAYTLDEFVTRYGVEEQRCRVVHLGVDERFSPEPAPVPALLAPWLRRVRPPYLLHVGAMIKRKDIGTLLRAFELLAGERPELGLVLAGNKTRRWASDWPTVRDWLRAHRRLRRRVSVLDYVPGAALPHLYRDASVVVSTALLEGFGLTALEAMASGTPVAASSGSAIEEIAGDVAYLFPARDAEACSQAVAAAMNDGHERRARGLQIARRLTWRRTAQRTLACYRALVRGESGP